MILETNNIWVFLLLLPLVSLLYASVGHGGASGYLALMALFSFSTFVHPRTATYSPTRSKPTAIFLGNCFTASSTKVLFLMASVPIIILSIPIFIHSSILERDLIPPPSWTLQFVKFFEKVV